MRETRKCRASSRTLQWVASGGRAFSVVSRIFCSNSEASPGPNLWRFRGWRRASQPPREKAARVARTVGRDSPVCRAMAWSETPWLGKVHIEADTKKRRGNSIHHLTDGTA